MRTVIPSAACVLLAASLAILSPAAWAQDAKPDSIAADPVKMGATQPVNPGAVQGAPVDQKTYVVGAEDILRVIIWGVKDMTGDYSVRPDGMISIPLVGDIQASGKTPQQIEAIVTEHLQEGKLIVHPNVTVGLLAVHSKKYFIQGEVNRPGAYDLVVPTTIMEGLVNAGGFRDFANTGKIRILRGSTELHFNYKQVSHGKHLEQNVHLEPGDQIIVP